MHNQYIIAAMNKCDVIVGAMHLKEASDLLSNLYPDASYKLLELAQMLLDKAEVSELELSGACATVDALAAEATAAEVQLSAPTDA